ncbi:MAG: hypothetical protein HC822_13805 [Oscillochloris sp.]|nr:hypothetical protein [Oscillochloris sp.]
MTIHIRRLHGRPLSVMLTVLILFTLLWPFDMLIARMQRGATTVSDWPGVYSYRRHAPATDVEAYVRPDLAQRMAYLRPTILAAAARHNHAELSGMTDQEFAAVIALIIYNENFGWLEDDVPPLRHFTPLYQDLQRQLNHRRPGSNFSVWPVNLRPSVAIEILEQRLPLPDGTWAELPLHVAGSRIDPDEYADRAALMAAVTDEISRDDLAVAYLAANLERGLFRAAYEDVAVDWRILAAWHNQGLVDPEAIRTNSTASDYLRRAAVYLPIAEDLIIR